MGIEPAKPVYTISVAADLIGVNPRILRIYEEKGLVKPSRTIKNRRLYSQNDLNKLYYIYYLAHVKKVNLAGVRVILDILDKLKESDRKKLFAEAEKEIEALNKSKVDVDEIKKIPNAMDKCRFSDLG